MERVGGATTIADSSAVPASHLRPLRKDATARVARGSAGTGPAVRYAGRDRGVVPPGSRHDHGG
ncbi:hypothetical protein [Spirillospora sp. CA-294931]|uniref:hypothetical protein n=1 Tax=Spirillospora sp. CA-294931 TaxID=3240042 RepID=UPI003D8A03E1